MYGAIEAVVALQPGRALEEPALRTACGSGMRTGHPTGRPGLSRTESSATGGGRIEIIDLVEQCRISHTHRVHLKRELDASKASGHADAGGHSDSRKGTGPVLGEPLLQGHRGQAASWPENGLSRGGPVGLLRTQHLLSARPAHQHRVGRRASPGAPHLPAEHHGCHRGSRLKQDFRYPESLQHTGKKSEALKEASLNHSLLQSHTDSRQDRFHLN